MAHAIRPDSPTFRRCQSESSWYNPARIVAIALSILAGVAIAFASVPLGIAVGSVSLLGSVFCRSHWTRAEWVQRMLRCPGSTMRNPAVRRVLIGGGHHREVHPPRVGRIVHYYPAPPGRPHLELRRRAPAPTAADREP
ncbi:MAG: hypothetical protein RL235_1084, partial [Chlamydiota bacterium]